MWSSNSASSGDSGDDYGSDGGIILKTVKNSSKFT